MKIYEVHGWDVSPKEAMEIQERLRKQIVLENAPEVESINKIGAADVSYDKKTNLVYATVVIFSFPDLRVLEEKDAIRPATFPYIPGLLVFREGPALIEAFQKIATNPDVIIFDGQGIAHPRGIGIATHMGILLDEPSIGCAKTVLVGDYAEPEETAGSQSPLIKEGVELGVALRTKNRVEPVFVSIGHKIDLKTAIKIVLECTRGYRLPEPVRQAHIVSNKLRERKEEQQESLF